LAGVDTTAPSFYLEAENQTDSPSTKGLRTSRRLQHSSPNVAALADPDDSTSDEEDELEDDSDAELLEHVRKLEGHAQAQSPAPRPTASRKKSKGDDDDNELERSSSEEIFPSPGTRAGAEKRRRTLAAKVAPYEPPRGTRAASMVEKERARNAAARRR